MLDMISRRIYETQSFQSRFSLYSPYFSRVQFSRNGLWNLHECIRVFFCLHSLHEMLLSPFAPVQVLIMALLIQARHLFYGISMLDKFKGMGWKKYYLIFGMCDETFSVNYTADIPEDIDRGWFMFFVTLLDQLYWGLSATLGALLGSLLKFDTNGISFVMTAMFVVIFLEQWFKEKDHTASVLGLTVTALCLILFGADAFMIPTMLLILIFLAILRKKLEKKEADNP